MLTLVTSPKAQTRARRTRLSSGDRRRTLRFAISLNVKYAIQGIVGEGTSIDISSRGVRFTADQLLPSKGTIVLSLAWPCLLDDRVPLQLSVEGKVVRSSPGFAVVKILRHEFRLRNDLLKSAGQTIGIEKEKLRGKPMRPLLFPGALAVPVNGSPAPSAAASRCTPSPETRRLQTPPKETGRPRMFAVEQL